MLYPINRMTGGAEGGMDRLSTKLDQAYCRIPTASDVSLLKGMKTFVEGAATASGCPAPVHAVTFPGMGNQARFRAEMSALLPMLPSSKTHTH